MGCFLRDAGVREITPLISHRCIPKLKSIFIMSSFIKRNSQNKVVNSIT